MQPAPWAAGDPNRDILFDWSEFTYNDAGLWLNSSQVDMFAVPHAVTVTGANGATRRTGELVTNGRNAVIDGVRAQSGWANTVYTRSDGTVLRVLAPGKAADAGLFSATYLDPTSPSAWNAYTDQDADRGAVRQTSRTPGSSAVPRGNVMNFTNTAGQQVASFNRPSHRQRVGLRRRPARAQRPGGRPDLPDAVRRAEPRHPGHHRHPAERQRRPTSTATAPTNHYSRIIHANMVDGKAYGFAFDDVGAHESLVHDGDPRAAGIILTPFGAGGPTNPPTASPTMSPTSPPTTAPPSGSTWAAYTPYTVGQIVTYNGVRYQCRQAHTSLPGWEPPNVLALWLPI